MLKRFLIKTNQHHQTGSGQVSHQSITGRNVDAREGERLGFARVGDKLGPFDLVAVPIGALEPRVMMRASQMNPEEAVQAAIDLKAQNSVAIHFGTFVLSD